MDVPSDNAVALSALAVGKPFFYNGQFYAKTDDSTKNAFTLASGVLVTIPVITMVTPAAVKVAF